MLKCSGIAQYHALTSQDNGDGKRYTPIYALRTLATTELQSPLEIPGVLGLDRYMRQQEATLSWRSVVGERRKEKGKKSSKTKPGAKGKTSKTKTKTSAMMALSALSSSADEAEGVSSIAKGGGGELPSVHHVVNRGDGEMPENALSSGEENVEKVRRASLIYEL